MSDLDESPLLAVARNGKNGAHNGPSVVGPGPGLEEGAASENPGRSIFVRGTAAGDPNANIVGFVGPRVRFGSGS